MRKLLITGAAGFIGNAACRRYRDRYQVIAVDDLSRPTSKIPEGVDFIKTNALRLDTMVADHVDIVLHLAGQVSVVESYTHPMADFWGNAELGLSVAMWCQKNQPRCVIYSSTNKVYGELRPPIFTGSTIDDYDPISPETPYGISKAAAGLYIRELLPETGYDFRQSCIYGETQVGTEDQGWVGYVLRRTLDGQPVTCYGDGEQVRDLLHVEDLLDAYDLAMAGGLRPGSYTVGGGPSNAVTFREAVELLGGKIASYASPRPKDQHYFVAASDGLRAAGWEPKVNACQWLAAHRVEKAVTA